MKAIGTLDLSIKELKEEQEKWELAAVERGEYGPKYLSKDSMPLLHPDNAKGYATPPLSCVTSRSDPSATPMQNTRVTVLVRKDRRRN
eukprot:475680-Prorocentrum_minimum.AAC.1